MNKIRTLYCPRHKNKQEILEYGVLEQVPDVRCQECQKLYRTWQKELGETTGKIMLKPDEELTLYAEAVMDCGSELAGPPKQPWLPGFIEQDRRGYIDALRVKLEQVKEDVVFLEQELEKLTDG